MGICAIKLDRVYIHTPFDICVLVLVAFHRTSVLYMLVYKYFTIMCTTTDI